CAALAEVRPDALLDSGYRDDVPLQAFGCVRRDDRDAIGSWRRPRECGRRKLLIFNVLEESRRSRAGEAIDVPPYRIEQLDHRVQVTISHGTGGTAGQGLAMPRPGESCG